MDKEQRKIYNANYYNNNKYNTNRKRIINNLNNNKVYPKKSTISKYNLLFDGVNGIWS